MDLIRQATSLSWPTAATLASQVSGPLVDSELVRLNLPVLPSVSVSSSSSLGYTGYISAPYQVVLPIKNFERTGKPVEPVVKDQATTETVHKTKESE